MQILSFKTADVSRLLESFNVKVNEKGELLSKDIIKCSCCGKILKKEHVGSILPSSPYRFYCDNPICIAEYVRKTKFEK